MVQEFVFIIKVYMQNCPIDFFSKIKVFKITARTALKAISLKSQKQADHTEATL